MKIEKKCFKIEKWEKMNFIDKNWLDRRKLYCNS